MLIATQYGLYSILPTGAEVFHICGGCRRDLENLLSLTDVDASIKTTDGSGNRCWIEVDLDEVFEVMTQLSVNAGLCDFSVEHVDAEGAGESLYKYTARFEA